MKEAVVSNKSAKKCDVIEIAASNALKSAAKLVRSLNATLKICKKDLPKNRMLDFHADWFYGIIIIRTKFSY